MYFDEKWDLSIIRLRILVALKGFTFRSIVDSKWNLILCEKALESLVCGLLYEIVWK